MRIALAGIALLALVLPVRAEEEPPGELLDGIVAVVGDEPVTRSELSEMLVFQGRLLKARKDAGLPAGEAEKQFRKLQVETLRHLVDNRLILLAAKADGMSVTEEVRRRVEKLKTSFSGDVPKLEKYLAAQGFSSLADYERQMGEEMLRQRMVFAQVRPRAEIADREAQAAFDERFRGKRAEALGCEGAAVSRYALEQVWFPLPEDAAPELILAAYGQAYACYLGMSAGKFGGAEAPEQCKGTVVPLFGDLGEVDETKTFERSFQDAFDELRKAAGSNCSEPFLHKDGVRILRITGTREECIDDPEEVTQLRDTLRGRLEEEKFEKVLDWWLEELRGKFRVEMKAL
ncbi:MAG: hypothetical protein FJ109_15655 [Deltaproteobacteria bacterium]|nr:hypothetical protein [Deltaproteobacteria bacterium]